MSTQDQTDKMLKSRRTWLMVAVVTTLVTPSRQHPAVRTTSPPSEEIPTRTYYVEEDVNAASAHFLRCPTPENLQGFDDPRYNVSWSYNGVPLPWRWDLSTFKLYRPNGTWTLYSDMTEYGDGGNYTCTVTSANGTQITKTFSVCLTVTLGRTEPPAILDKSGTSFAKPGRPATFYCKADIGIPRCLNPYRTSVHWLRWLPDGTAAPLEPSSNVEVTKDFGTRGVLSSHLKIRSLESTDFGVYSCNITNKFGSTLQNMTLRDGVPYYERQAGKYMTIVVVLLVIMLSAPALIIIYNRLKIPWAMWRWKRYRCVPDGYDYDVYLIYGETASEWIWQVLQPRLRSYDYSCFILDRDMLGGENIIESIGNNVQKCRRVIVVLTLCLLENPWCAWAMRHAINAAMNTSTRMIILGLQGTNEMGHIPDPRGIRGMLRTFKSEKIQVPFACGLDLLEMDQPKAMDSKDGNSQKSNSESTCSKFSGWLLDWLRKFCAMDDENHFWGTLCLRLSSPLKDQCVKGCIYAKEWKGKNVVTHV